MARPTKDGLDYFPLDTDMDDNFDLIEAKHGLVGFAVIIKLYQKAYKEYGYYYPWREREQLLFSKWVNVDINLVNVIIMDAITFGIFDKDKYDLGVITSHGIQKRFLEASKRRKHLTLYEDLLLVNVDIISVNASNNGQAVEFLSYIGTYIKGERKGETGKGNGGAKTNAPVCVGSFDSFLQLFTQTWNDSGCSPRFTETLAVNLTTDEKDKFGKASARIKDIPRAIKAIQNYGAIQKSKEHEIHGNFKLPGFLISGIDQYADDADPWTKMRKKPQVIPFPEKMGPLDDRPDAWTGEDARRLANEAAKAKESMTGNPFDDWKKNNPDSPLARKIASAASESFSDDDDSFADPE